MKKDKNNYINQDKLDEHLKIWQDDGIMTDELGQMFMDLAEGMSNDKMFNKYTNNWKDEMIGKAVLYLCKYAHNYNRNYPNNNPFSYCNKIVYNAFRQAIKKLKKNEQIQNDLKDAAGKVRKKLGLENSKQENADDQNKHDI